MQDSSPLFLFSAVVLVLFSPCLALVIAALHRASQERKGSADARLIAKLRQVDQEKQDMVTQREDGLVQTNQFVDRIRMLERLLIEERRYRLVETQELLKLRDTCKKQQEKLVKAANAIRQSTAAISRVAPTAQKKIRLGV
jgi:TolA-binding protein